MIAVGDSITIAPGSYAALLATTIGIGIANYAVSGATMLGGEELAPGVRRSSIRDQMLALQPPTQYEPVVMILGTNDMSLYGANAPHLAVFSAALQTGLLHLTSRRRIPEPQNERERRLLRERKLPAVPDAPRVCVGNCLRQAAGNYVGIASPTAQAAYNAAISSTVAAVAAQGRPVRVVDVASVYVPATMSDDVPSRVHPNATGHAALASKFLAEIRA